AVLAFLQKDTGHVGRDAEPDIDGPAIGQLYGDATGNHLLYVEGRRPEGGKRAEDFSRNRRVVRRLGGLQLIGIDNDVIDEHARYPHIVRLQRPVRDYPLDLGDNDAAIVAGGERLVERAEIGALVLVCEIAALVRAGCTDDRDLRRDGGEI